MFRNATLIVGSVLFHIAAIWIFVPQFPVIGKNIPTLVYPVRVRVIAAPPISPGVMIREPAPVVGTKEIILPTFASAPVAEGKIERSEIKFTETSDRYFAVSEIENRPVIVAPPDLGAMELSPLAEGSAKVIFFINELGLVDRMEIEESTLPVAMVEALVAQKEKLTFRPGNTNGVNVKSVIEYVIDLTKSVKVETLSVSNGEAP